MSNNNVKDWGEFAKLAELPCLVELVFVGEDKQALVLSLCIIIYIIYIVLHEIMQI